ncbi:tellurite resistance TerB family protein [Rhizobium sp. C1]|uniref:tellurite resistance TerB family protein n=1 Tax=Rhizobium sp. C1 TaxID=1349799 RepID=UPI001E54C57E|nr:TerB family tellurite resistance protein [Rhizobium sp. C1]MCD2179306.1 TerB family tellurite resistance protein [Rhizobium sp. C1]
MFETIVSFLHDIVGATDRTDDAVTEARVAAVAICNQVMAADGKVTPEERALVADVFKTRFGLDDAHLNALLEAGERAEKEAVDFFHFTSVLKRELPIDRRNAFVGLLWDIVYADGEKTEVEDHVIWRIADLLGVDGRERVEQRIAAEKRARERLKLDS